MQQNKSVRPRRFEVKQVMLQSLRSGSTGWLDSGEEIEVNHNGILKDGQAMTAAEISRNPIVNVKVIVI